MVNTTEKAEMWMELALKEAEIAGQEGEIPVGAIIVKNDKIIGKGFNQREKFRNVFAVWHLDPIPRKSLFPRSSNRFESQGRRQAKR